MKRPVEAMTTSTKFTTLVITWSIGFTCKSATACLAGWLLNRGYEIDRERSGWRVLMFRKSSSQWTQVYTGQTRRAKAERSRVKVAGPEASALEPVKDGFYQDGEFAARHRLIAESVTYIKDIAPSGIYTQKTENPGMSS